MSVCLPVQKAINCVCVCVCACVHVCMRGCVCLCYADTLNGFTSW